MRAALLAARLLVLVALLTLVAPTAPALAADGATPVAGPVGTVTPTQAKPGDRVTVDSTGWPAFTQVQGVVCGDLAIGGSSTCDQSAGVLGAADAQGALRLDLLVGTPPRPCPCVIRVASYSGAPVALEIPFIVEGHPTGTPPQVLGAKPDVRVTDVRLEGGGGLASFFGAGPQRRVVMTLTNQGKAPAVNPEVRLGIGKSDQTEPSSVSKTDVTIDPLQSVQVSVDVALPVAAFGSYNVVTQAGKAATPVVVTTWTAYPWGLIVLNLIGLGLLLWGLWRRTRLNRAARREAIHGPAPVETVKVYPLPDVVYVESLGGFLVSPQAAARTSVLKRVKGRLATQDLVNLLAAEGADTSVLAGTSVGGAAAGAAVVDVTAADRWLSRRGQTAGATATEPERHVTARGQVASGGEALVDTAAVDTWLAQRAERNRSAPH